MPLIVRRPLLRTFANPPPLVGNALANPYAMGSMGNNIQVTVTADQKRAPDGTMLADLCVPTSSSVSNHMVRQQGVTTTALDWILRWRVRPAGYNFCELIIASTSGYATYCTVVVDLGKAAAIAQRSATLVGRPSVRRLADGWVLIDLVSTITALSTYAVECHLLQTNEPTLTYAGDTVSGFHLWGAEFAPVPN